MPTSSDGEERGRRNNGPRGNGAKPKSKMKSKMSKQDVAAGQTLPKRKILSDSDPEYLNAPSPKKSLISVPAAQISRTRSGSIEPMESDLEGVISTSTDSEEEPPACENLDTRHNDIVPANIPATTCPSPAIEPSPVLGRNKYVRVNLDEPTHENIPEDIRQVFISSLDKQVNLARMNPFKVGSSLDDICGKVAAVEHKKSGSILVTTKTRDQVMVLLKTKTFSTSLIPINVKVAWGPHISQGKIYAPEFIDMPLEEILTYLKPEGIVGIRKLLNDPAKQHIPLYVLSFLGKECPPKIRTMYSYYKVDPFYPNPIRCSKCFKLGHTSKNCHGKVVCDRCGTGGHQIEQCVTNTLSCRNCKGAHHSSSKQCPIFIEEKSICRIKVDNGLTFKEARIQFSQVPQQLGHQQQEPFMMNIASHTAFPPLHDSPARLNTAASTYTNQNSSSQSQAHPTQGSHTGRRTAENFENSLLTPAQRTPRHESNIQLDESEPPLILSGLESVNSINVEAPESTRPNPRRSAINTPQETILKWLPARKSQSTSEAKTSEFKDLLVTLVPCIIKLFLAKTVTEKIEIFLEMGNILDANNIVQTCLTALGLTSLSSSN